VRSASLIPSASNVTGFAAKPEPSTSSSAMPALTPTISTTRPLSDGIQQSVALSSVPTGTVAPVAKPTKFST
jgi:hypothetical protein